MAEPSAATQSPSVSSSSSGTEPSALGGSGSPGACPTLGAKSCGSSCADSFVSSSSSQPVSLFSTSQEGLSSLCSDDPPSKMTSSFFASSEIRNTDLTILPGEKSEVSGSQPILAKEEKDCSAHLDVKKMEKPQWTSKDVTDSPGSIAEGSCYNRPSIPASFPDHPALLSKEVGQMEQQINKDQESKNPNEVPSRDDKTALDADDKFNLPRAQKPPTEQSKAGGICTYSLSPSKVSAGGIIEKDSPESPFEVIIDRAAFDKEFKDAYKESMNDFGSWVMHTDRESSADISESNDKVLPLRNKDAGRYPTSALLTRQFSHTTAALEEVSRCVNDMHNFTNEILTWDLVPQVKQSDKSDYITKTTRLDTSEYNSEIAVVNLKTNTHQKIPVCSVKGSTPITKSADDWAEASLPLEKAVTEKPLPGSLDATKDVSSKSVQGNVQKQDDTLSELPGSLFGKYGSLGSGIATVKVVLPDDHLKGEMNWHNSVLGEVTEADSSGESDDTIIEDITADISFKSNKIQAVSIPSAVVKTDEREIKESLNCIKENKTSENFEGSVSDSEPQAQPDVLERSPANEVACSQVPGKNVMSEDVKQSDIVSEIAPENPVRTENPKLPSAAASNVFKSETEFSLNVTTSAYWESLHEKCIEDIDDSSPEDLIAAFTETREEGIVDKGERNAFETTSEKSTDFKTTLPIEVLHKSESGGSEIKDVESKYSEQSKETNGSELLHVFPTRSTPVASLDLEQEQLTIKALKELSERQDEKSASAQDKVESPEEILKQTFTLVPESSRPQRSYDVLEHTDLQTGSDLGISKKPTIIKETASVDISSLNKTGLINKHVLARLLTDFSVHDLIFWRDVKKTGFVFGTTLIVLLSLAAFSVISVISYLILALLSVTISFRVYRSVIQAVQKSEEGHPFKAYLDVDITLSSEAFHNYVNAAMVHINRALKLIIRLFLVEDLVDSLKLAVFMWLMTYVGAVFNGITLLILAELLIFSVPIVYEKYKTQIDHYVGIARDQTKSIVEKIQAKLPGIAKKKAE